MATEEKKDAGKMLDIKSQQKLLKKAVKDEIKKNSQLTQENKQLYDKLQKLQDINTEINDSNINLVKTIEELKEELQTTKKKLEDVSQQKAVLVPAPPAPKAELLAKASAEIDFLRKERQVMMGQMETIKTQNQKLTKDVDEKSKELAQALQKFDDQSKAFETQCKEQNEKLEYMRRDYDHTKNLTHDIQVELANKDKELKELRERATCLKDENMALAKRLIDMKQTLLEYGTSLRFFPAVEIKKKTRTLVTMRFLKEEGKGYFLQVAWLSDKKQFHVAGITMHIHPENSKCVVISLDKSEQPMMVFETEFADDLCDVFRSYKKETEDIIAPKVLAAQAKSSSVGNIGDFICIDKNEGSKN